MPSIGDALFVSIFIRALASGGDFLNDGDTGWHIVTGDYIIKNRAIPSADIFSHTAYGAPWTTHEWLAETAFAAVHRVTGLNGIVVMCAAVAALTFLMLYRWTTSRGASPITAAAVTILGASVSAHHWLARPHIFSLPLTLAFFIVLDDYVRGQCDRLWLLPVLMVAWANLHAGFFLGIVMTAVYAASELAWYLSAAGGEGKRIRRLGITFAAVTVASFANPNGPALLTFPFHLTGRQFVMDKVQEWASVDFHVERGFELLLILTVALAVISRKKPSLAQGILLMLTAHMSLVSVRFAPLFVILAVPVCAELAGEILSEAASLRSSAARWAAEKFAAISGRASGIEDNLRGNAWSFAAIAATAYISINGGTAFGAAVMDYRFSPDKFPVSAMEFVNRNNITGRLYNVDAWGGYIVYAGYPEHRVFIDGRYDMYSVELLKKYLDVAKPVPQYADILDKYGVTCVMFDTDSALVRLLEQDSSWRKVYSDRTASVLVRG